MRAGLINQYQLAGSPGGSLLLESLSTLDKNEHCERNQEDATRKHTTNNGSGPYVFRGLRPDQVAFGLPSGPSSANSGQASLANITAALNCLTRLTQCGAIKPLAAYPTLRGVMTWSINWDRKDGLAFSRGVRNALNSLP